jgi:hypothetical protein
MNIYKLQFCNVACLFLNHFPTTSPCKKQRLPARMIFINDGAATQIRTEQWEKK